MDDARLKRRDNLIPTIYLDARTRERARERTRESSNNKLRDDLPRSFRLTGFMTDGMHPDRHRE
jgi:hypothetical protein